MENINNEIDYEELKELSIKIFNKNFHEIKNLEKNFNIFVKKKLYNESKYNLKIKILFHFPNYYLIILNDFIKFTFNIVQKNKENICSIIFNSCYIDGYKSCRLPEYKYHYYLLFDKEKSILKWFNEYKEILNEHLNKNLNQELYNRQVDIIINLMEKNN